MSESASSRRISPAHSAFSAAPGMPDRVRLAAAASSAATAHSVRAPSGRISPRSSCRAISPIRAVCSRSSASAAAMASICACGAVTRSFTRSASTRTASAGMPSSSRSRFTMRAASFSEAYTAPSTAHLPFSRATYPPAPRPL